MPDIHCTFDQPASARLQLLTVQFIMDILQTNNDKKGFFYVKEGEEILAKMVYVWAGSDRIIIEHTEVNDRLRGKGAGRQMVEAAVRFARETGIKIVPLCPFARSVFNKVKEFADVL